VIGALAGMVLGVCAWFISGATYLGVVTMVVIQPRTAPSIVSTASYRALFENHSVALKAIEKAGLTDRGTPMTPQRFLRRVLTIQERRNTSLLEIQIRLRDPDMAASVANNVAEEALLLGRRLSEEDGMLLRAQLKSQRDDALKNLESADLKLLDYRQASRIELLRTDVDAMIRQQQTLLGVEVDLLSEQARVATATAEQSARTPKLSLERRIDQDPTVLEAARAQAGGDTRGLLGLGLKTEELNPTYLRLDSEVALSRARIAQLERQRQAIVDIAETERKNGMLSELYSKEMNLQRLEAERNLTRTVYQDVAVRYEQARTGATVGSAQLLITDPAIPIRTPVSWSIWLWLAVGATLGTLVFPGLVASRAVARVFSVAAQSTN
jgi:uncharacterized protein involved in exopolysaccharide biosynthesis